MPNRYSPDSLGYIITITSESEQGHWGKRLLTSMAVLTTLMSLVRRGAVAADARVSAEGSTLQARSGGGVQAQGKEWAHQTFRELSLDDVPIHLLPNLSEQERVILLYCNSAVSKIPALYNRVDGLIETHIRSKYVVTAEWAMKEASTRSFLSIAAMSEFLRQDVWLRLLDNSIAACQSALVDTQQAAEQALLNRYIRSSTQLKREAMLLYIQSEARLAYKRTAVDWGQLISPHVRRKPNETDHTIEQKRLTLLGRVQAEIVDFRQQKQLFPAWWPG